MTELKPIKGKAIYTTYGAASEYGRIGCNFYKGCPHGCTYCDLKRGAPSKQLGGTQAVLKKCLVNEYRALEIFRAEVRKHIDALQRHGLFFSFTTDPLILQTRDLTISAIAFLNSREVPTWVLTKDATFLEDFIFQESILRGLENKDIAHFGFTLTGRDDMEPNASSNHDRIEAMRQLHNMGFKTFASIEPVIDWQHASMVVSLSLNCCDHYKIGLRSGVGKDYYDLVQSGMNIRHLTEQIVKSGRTVYLKKSTRALMRRCFIEEECERILSMTLDMYGQPYKKGKN